MNDETATVKPAERVWKKYRATAFTFGKDERGRALHCLNTEVPGKAYHFFLPSKLVDSHVGVDRCLSDDAIFVIENISLPDNFEIRLWNKVDGEKIVSPAELVELGIIEPFSEEDYARKAQPRAKKSSSRREHTPEPLEPISSVDIPAELRR